MNQFPFIIGCMGLLLTGLAAFFILSKSSRVVLALTISIIMLLLAPVIIPASYALYATYNRLIFSFYQDGTILLTQSPFKIPINAAPDYCAQFHTQNNKVIAHISKRDDGAYCGEFWQFYEPQTLVLPYQKVNDTQALYWASPQLKIVGPLLQTQPLKLQYYEENSLKG